MQALPGTRINGDGAPRLANTASVTLPGVDSEALMASLPQLCVASNAACASAARLPSYVLRAMGVAADGIRGSLRISLGRFTTGEEVDEAAEAIIMAVGQQQGA